MNVRILLVAAAAAFATPALAAPYPADEDSYDAIEDSLPAPEDLDRAGERLHRILGALMDVRVGPLAEAVDPERAHDGRRHDETLGDMASRDDPYFEERMHASVGAITQSMGAMMVRLAHVAPVLRRSIEDMERSVEDATRDLPRRHGD